MEPLEPFDPEYKDVRVTATNGNAWLAPAKLPEVQAAALSGPPPIYDLRPLTTGEVLDRTFSVYRSRFWLFAGIASFSAVVESVAATSQMVLQHRTILSAQTARPGTVAGGFPNFHFGVPLLVMLVAYLLYFLAASLTQAATAFAVSEVYLGRSTSIKAAFAATIQRWFSYIVIGLWQLCGFIWLPALILIPAMVLVAMKVPGLAVVGGLLAVLGFLGGGIGGFILGLRNALAIPATVIERLNIRPTMRRSKVLSSGAKGRIFLLLVISGCLYMVVGVLQTPLSFVMLYAMAKGHAAVSAEAGMLIIGFLGHSVVTPVALIGFTLVYFDQRVRKEAFDLVVLLGDEQAIVASAAAAAKTAPVAGEGRVDDGALL